MMPFPSKRLRGIAVTALLVASPIVPASPASAQRVQRVVSVYDGDTATVFGVGSVRFAGYDTPERGTRARCPREARLALEARDVLAALVADGVTLRRAVDDRGRLQVDRERWGRPLRTATTADGRDVADAMLAARSADGSALAVPYWGHGPRMDWCKPGAGR